MQAFIDFDGVLFDIARHKREYFRLFEKHGISSREAKRVYDEMKRAIGKDDQRYYVARLKERGLRLTPAEAMRDIYAFKGRGASSVYKEARPFLSALKRSGFELHLVTSGDKILQKQKVMTSGLAEYFDNIHMLDSNDKVSVIGKYSDRRFFSFFLDDRASIVEGVKNNLPYVRVLHMVRGRGGESPSKQADAVVSNLREALRIIRKESRK